MPESKPYFDQIAGRWDEVSRSFFGEAVRDKALHLAGVQAGETAADIGAGSGFITEALLQKGLKVIAVDQSGQMLQRIRDKFPNDPGLDCRQGEAENLPIDTGTVDYVFANMYLHHVEFPEKAIGEMARILNRGGTLIITDLDEHGHSFLAEEHHDRWMGFKRSDVKRWFEAADLNNVSIDCLGETCSSESAGRTETADVSIFVATGVK
jgi:ubiquinone/menaquinone biosynthesis C-methylase UbiE